MALHLTIDRSNERRTAGAAASRAVRIAGLVGVVGLGLSVVASILQGSATGFFRSYLINYTYFLSLALGALFFVLLQHLTRSGWSVAVRRLAELIAGTLPFLALLFIPVLVAVFAGLGEVYAWADRGAAERDHLLALKRPYLNPGFFTLRCILYFAVWSVLAHLCLKWSRQQDATGDPTLTVRLERLSAPAMLLFAFSSTFFAFDVLMSLNPGWYSTIFGVYFFSGSVVGFFALLAVLLAVLQATGRLTQSITTEHYHDVGKLLFAFVVFWAYIAFSQYMLIWYGDIPEETVWYRARQTDSWWVGTSLLLLFGHFVLPFLALLSRYPKRRRTPLLVAAGWMLCMHWLDLYYLVAAPTQEGATQSGGLLFTDVTLLVGLGGLFVAALAFRMRRGALLAERDPRLAESLAFENV